MPASGRHHAACTSATQVAPINRSCSSRRARVQAKEHGVERILVLDVERYDDLTYCELCSPSLSTIHFDSSALGDSAVALINSLITGEPPEDRFLQAPIPYAVQRDST